MSFEEKIAGFSYQEGVGTMQIDSEPKRNLALLKWLSDSFGRDITPNGLLAHYTNVQGLYGILDSGKIWLTNTRYLNDPHEIEYGKSLTFSILDNEWSFNQHDPDRAEFLCRVRKSLAHLDETELNFDVYVFSMAQCDDQLSQWRGYTPPYGLLKVNIPQQGRRQPRLSNLSTFVRSTYNNSPSF